ncbi:hypothetical protein E2542_SST14204 [Spatholobus suberectus]|nr:hypothetical protein E2542_SST14204 [Spatholobus suberectus]
MSGRGLQCFTKLPHPIVPQDERDFSCFPSPGHCKLRTRRKSKTRELWPRWCNGDVEEICERLCRCDVYVVHATTSVEVVTVSGGSGSERMERNLVESRRNLMRRGFWVQARMFDFVIDHVGVSCGWGLVFSCCRFGDFVGFRILLAYIGLCGFRLRKEVL